MAVAPARPRAEIYPGTRIPSPIPTSLLVPDDLQGLDDVMRVNFGPNHPSTHGVLRLIVDLYGEQVVGLEAVIGYLHTGFEKNMEQKTWWKGSPIRSGSTTSRSRRTSTPSSPRSRSCSSSRCRAKAVWMRTCLLELNRLHSHLVWLGTSALELGAISMFWYASASAT